MGQPEPRCARLGEGNVEWVEVVVEVSVHMKLHVYLREKDDDVSVCLCVRTH